MSKYSKLKRTGKELIMGSRTYLPKSAEGRRTRSVLDEQTRRLRKKQEEVKKLLKTTSRMSAYDRAAKKKSYTTTRTSSVSRGLKRAGLTDKDVKTLRDK